MTLITSWHSSILYQNSFLQIAFSSLNIYSLYETPYNNVLCAENKAVIMGKVVILQTMNLEKSQNFKLYASYILCESVSSWISVSLKGIWHVNINMISTKTKPINILHMFNVNYVNYQQLVIDYIILNKCHGEEIFFN